MAFAPLSPNTLHVVIDMQRLFAEETAWHTPALTQILPNVVRLARASGTHTIFARFMTPQQASDAPGQWQAYYRRWSSVTGEATDPALFDLVASLAGLPGTALEKTTYSLFGTPAFDQLLRTQQIDTVIFSGVETDVCVYASVLGAIDRGLRCIIVTDAVASSDPAAHHATLTHLAPRLCDQLELIDTETAVAALHHTFSDHHADTGAIP